MNKVLRYLKAHVALVGAVAVWYLATYPNGGEVKWVSAGVAILTALGVATVPNRTVDDVLEHTFPDPAARSDAGYTLVEVAFALVLVVIALILLLHFLH